MFMKIIDIKKNIEKILDNNKAKNIQATSRILVEKHNAIVPPNLSDLVDLPGVGRKTANVVLGQAFDIDLVQFAGNDEARIVAQLREVFTDPIFKQSNILKDLKLFLLNLSF